MPGGAPSLRTLRALAYAGSKPAHRGRAAALLLIGGLGVAIAAGLAWATVGSTRPVPLDPPADAAVSAASGLPASSISSGRTGPGGQGAARSGPVVGASDPATAASWLPVLAELDERRSEAFASADPSLLTGVYAPESAVLAVETRRLDELRSHGLKAIGLRLVIAAARPIRTASGVVLLEVRDELLPYDLVDEHGAVVEHRPGRGERTWHVALVPAGTASGEWRISQTGTVGRRAGG